MSGGLFAYRSASDAATLSVSTSALAGYQLSHIQKRSGFSTRIDQGTITRYLVIDFGQPVLPHFICLFGLNATVMAPNMITGFSHSPNNIAWTAAGSLITPSDLGMPTLPNDIKVLVSNGLTPARYWRFNLNWSRPPGQAYFQINRLLVYTSRGMIVVPKGVDARWTPGIVTASVAHETPGGQVSDDKRTILRTLGVSVSAKDAKLMWGFESSDVACGDVSSFHDMQMTAGTTGEIVVAPRSANPLWLHRQCFRGRIPRGFSLPHQSGDLYSTSAEIREER
jgi:hypothetical protein